MSRSLYYVEYEVEGFAGVQKCGPYSSCEIDSQTADIKTFEGVINLRIVPVQDKVDPNL